jgi:hypothetical protein
VSDFSQYLRGVILGSLKQKVDQSLAHQSCIEELVAQAQDFLVGREEKLANARRHALEALNPPASFNNSSISNGSNISNDSSRRSSLTSDIFSRGTASCPALYLHHLVYTTLLTSWKFCSQHCSGCSHFVFLHLLQQPLVNRRLPTVTWIVTEWVILQRLFLGITVQT